MGVRFAPSSGSNDANKNNEVSATNNPPPSAEDGAGGGVSNPHQINNMSFRRASIESALHASMRFPNRRRASNASSTGSMNRRSSNASVSAGASLLGGNGQQPTTQGVNTAIAANDGPSLAAALAQSIRHHAKLIDGEQPTIKGVVRAKAVYDPYQDDDQVSLAPGVELNYEKDAAQPAANATQSQERAKMTPALREFVANAAIEELSNDPREKDSIERSMEQQQQKIGKRMNDMSFSNRLTSNISNWFGYDTSDTDRDNGGGIDYSDRTRSRSVRFAGEDDTVAVAAAIAAGEALPGTAYGIVGRAPKFIAPPATSFRTATRHPSHLSPDEFDNMESRLNAPRRILAARKRHRRNDSFLRLMVAVVCFALSLTFAIIYGEGKFGLAVTNMAYDRKVSSRGYDIYSSGDDMNSLEEDVFYPDWWEEEKGIPDMVAKEIKFAPHLEYNAADVVTPRAPDRIETPFFWFVPRSGGNAIRTIMSKCLRLAEASEHGADDQAGFIRIVEAEDRRFVNVDMSTSQGIIHANELKLASSGVADVIISQDIHGVLKVFNNRNRARIFAIFRHPLDRAISKYYSVVASDPEMAGLTLPQYVRSGGQQVENNYLTRYLSGQYGGRLTRKHLDIAREFLRRKFVVGLARDLPATSNLFSHVFGWNNTAAILGLENVDLCYSNIYSALTDKAPPTVEEGSEGWKLLVAQNWFDLKIYEYVEHLFQMQVDQLQSNRGDPSAQATQFDAIKAEQTLPERLNDALSIGLPS